MDAKRIIALIESHPVIWDKSLEDYKNRNLTWNAWVKVCRGMRQDFDSLDDREQHHYVSLVSRKWKNMRDTWTRAQKRSQSQSLSQPTSPGQQQNPQFRCGRNYAYQDQMAFLKKNWLKKPKEEANEQNGFDNHVPVPAESDEEPLEATPTTTTPNTDKIKVPCPTSQEEQEEEEQFFFPQLMDSGQSSSNSNTVSQPVVKRRKVDNNIIINNSIDEDSGTGNGIHSHRSLVDNNNYNFAPPSSLAVTSADQEDRHMLFLRSILPFLRQLDEEQTLEFHLGVLKLLQEVRKPKLSRPATAAIRVPASAVISSPPIPNCHLGSIQPCTSLSSSTVSNTTTVMEQEVVDAP